MPTKLRQKATPRRQKIMPHLWYAKEAEAAARFYASIFPDSGVDRVTPLPIESPSGPAGSVKIVDFRLFGQRFQAITAGPLDPFNHAISLVVLCDDQAELDRYWRALLADGGEPEMCGWLRDKFGVSWQIVPAELDRMIGDRDRERAIRVCEVMLQQQKLDMDALRAAYGGAAARPATARKQRARPRGAVKRTSGQGRGRKSGRGHKPEQGQRRGRSRARERAPAVELQRPLTSRSLLPTAARAMKTGASGFRVGR